MRLILVLLLGLFLAAAAMAGLYAFSPPTFVDVAVGAERWASGLRRKEITAGSMRMVYLDNDGTGESLVLVHGFGADKDNWVRVARPLGARYRIIAPDLPGYGESESPVDVHYRIEDNVERLHAFVQALGLSRAHFGGSSMGGHIVAAYAAKYPNEVGSLWLIANAGVRTAPKSELMQRLDSGQRNPLVVTTVRQYHELVGFSMSQPPALPSKVIDVMGERAVRASALRERQLAELSAADAPALENTIKGLPVPTHILWGDQDRALSVAAVEILKTLLPQASSTVLPGIGHLPMLEAPQLAAEDYLAFRDRLNKERLRSAPP